jgi:uncharacterized protein involved in outer membrane biogenesis
MRRITIGLLTLLAILVGLALIIPFFINVNDYKPEIMAKAKEALGRNVSIDGNISLHLLPTPQISVSQVSIANLPGGSPQDLLRIQTVKASIDLLPLFIKQVKINSIKLDHPDIFLEKLPNGQTNWTFGTSATVPQPQPSNAAPSTSAPLNISFKKVVINGGHLVYHEKGKDFEVSDINTTAHIPSLQGPYDISGTFKAYDQPINLDAKLGIVGESQDVFLKIHVGESLCTVEGKASLSTLAFQGKLAALADTKRLNLGDAKDATSPLLAKPIRIESQVIADSNGISLEQAKFEVGSAQPTGNIKITWADVLRAQGQLQNLPGQGQATFDLTPTPQGMTGSLNGSVNQAKDLLNWLAIDVKSIPAEFLGPLTLSTKFKKDTALHLRNLNLSIRDANLSGDLSWQTSKGLPILIVDLHTPKVENILKLFGARDPQHLGASRLNGNIQWDADSLRLSHMKGQLGSNFSFAGDVAIDQSGAKPKVKAVLSVNSINLAKLMASREGSSVPEARVFLISTRQHSHTSHWSQSPMDFGFLNKFDGHFDISSSQLVQNEIVLSHPKLVANLQNGQLDITSFTGSIYGGSLTGKGHITAGNAVHVHMSLTDANLKNIFSSGSSIKIVGGKLSTSLDLSTHGKSMDEMVRHVSGPVNVAAKNGLINGFDLHTLSQRLGNLQDPRSLMGLLTTSMGQGQTSFTSFNGDIAFQNGIGTIQSMKMVAPDAQGHATGQIDLPQYTINIHSEFQLTQHPKLPPFHMHLTGPIDNPSRKLDSANLQKYMMENVFKGVLGKLGKGGSKAQDVLGSILGGDNAPTQQQPSETPKSNKPEQIVKDVFKGIFK